MTRPAKKWPQIVERVRNGPPASAKDIACDCQISIASAHVTLLRLVRKGLIQRTGDRWNYRYTA